MHVYIITNLVTGKIYVGITSRSPRARFKEHMALARSSRPELAGRFLYNAMRKYPPDAWIFEEIATADTWEKIKKIEIELIAKHRSNDRRYGYNSTVGGDGVVGHTHSPATRLKLSLSHTGRSLSESAKEKLRELHRDPDYSAKVTAGLRSHKHSPAKYEEMAAKRRGAIRSGETRAKLSAAAKGKPKSPEAIAKSVASRLAMQFKKTPEQKEKSASFHRGRKRSPETCLRIKEATLRHHQEKRDAALSNN